MGAVNGAHWLDKLTRLERRYYPVDGGAGATLLAQLSAADSRLRPVDSPRHADILVLIEPVTPAFAEAVLDAYRHMPSPRRVVVVGKAAELAGAMALRVEDQLHVSERVEHSPTHPAAAAIVAEAMLRARVIESDAAPALAGIETPTEQFVPLRPVAEREMATEDLVVSLGPVQPAAAGPLQILLTMDGEQVVRAEILGGFAHRGVEATRTSMGWDDALSGATIDPLAPVAGQLAWTEAVERLRGIVAPAAAMSQRSLALQLERAASHLVWLTRFADLIGFRALADEARRLAATAAARVPAATAVLGDGRTDTLARDAAAPEELAHLARSVGNLISRLERDRMFAARTRGVGVLSGARARTAGASGAVLHASESGAGDVRARALSRLAAAVADLNSCASLARSAAGDAASRADRSRLPDAPVPAGVATVDVRGPRGVLSLRVESSGGERPASVRWSGPSRAHLALVAELVTGHTVPELLACVASLDLSMAEADG